MSTNFQLTEKVKVELEFIQDYGHQWIIEILNAAIHRIVEDHEQCGHDDKQTLKLVAQLHSVIDHIRDLVPEEQRKEASDEEDAG